jgi:tRNA 2-selenouridine synthase
MHVRRNSMFTVVPFDESLLETHLTVDVRTPLEYEDDHIPGAINVPLLSNDERVEIGIIHKNDGPHAARIRGLEMTASRFPGIVAEIATAATGRPILVYCWRGGLRSKTVASILGLTGHPVFQLRGGYKAYRAAVTSYFAPFQPPGPLIVLHGLTGVGKTTLLCKIGTGPFTVIDLEGLACHRGSAFGAVGLSQDLSQKRFESLLWDALRKSPPGRPVILEGESRRIGAISLPEELYLKMQDGFKVWCETTLSTRVARLIEEYGKPGYRDEMAASLDRIRKKLGGEKHAEIAGYLERWEMGPFMSELLLNYYDKVYYKTRRWTEDCVISLDDFGEAARTLEIQIKERFGIH